MGFIEQIGLRCEKVKVKKSNGELLDNIKAIFSDKDSVTMNVEVDIEEGDVIERMLPNGRCEKYKILDTGFVNGMGMFIDHYQAKVRKIIKDYDVKYGKENIVNNISCGENAKININSNDNSINIQNISKNEAIFKNIEDEIKKNNIENKEEILLAIAEMKKNIGKSSFKEKYLNFIALLSSHITIVTPFIPALANLLKDVK